jgi:arylformamidase
MGREGKVGGMPKARRRVSGKRPVGGDVVGPKGVREIIDLTYDLHEGMLTFTAPWHPVVTITQIGRIFLEGRETREVRLGTHTGTHVDAPLHVVSKGTCIEKIPLERLVGRVTILDFSVVGTRGEVSVNQLKRVALGKKLLFRFGWGVHWGTSQFYRDWPYFSKSAASYLIDEGVEMIGLDTPSPDNSGIVLSGKVLGSEADSPIHKMFLRANVVLVEYIANLDKVPDPEGWNIAALPLRIRGGDGSPARVFLFR